MGRHAVRELAGNGHEPVALDLRFQTPVDGAADSLVADLRDAAAIERIVRSAKPGACLHLGAISSVPEGETNPELLLAVNIMGTANLLEAARKHVPACRLLLVSTAHIYGASAGERRLKEDAPILPVSLYAVSKAAADLLTLGYAKRHGVQAMTARPNNHTGPGQSPRFVVPSFARQIRAIARGEGEPVLKVGNLESEREFADVRDVVRAYRLLMEKGRPGEAYNIAGNERMKVGEILDRLCKLAGVTPKITVDQAKYRPFDRSPLLDTGKLRKDTGWKPEIEFSQTLRDILAETST